MDWRHHAACREVDPELFFPIGNTGPALFQIEEAKGVCRRCPVVDSCLQWAVESWPDGTAMAFTGRLTRTEVPPPGRGLIASWPPSSDSTRVRTICSPRLA